MSTCITKKTTIQVSMGGAFDSSAWIALVLY